MSDGQDFYNTYHKKNDKFAKVIGRQNFTYYEILRFFYQKIYSGLPAKNHDSSQENHMKGVKVLDVGCGVGTLALYFAKHGAQVEGVDISDRAITICKEANEQLGLDVQFTVGEVKKGKANKDLVVISEVIEHIKDEAAFLAILRSHLKKGGTLYVTTPLKENMLYKMGAYTEFDVEVGHERRYTEQNIQDLLNANGFEVQAHRIVEGPMRNLLYITKLGFLIKFIRGPLVPIYHKMDYLSMKIFGASNVLVAAKKV